MARHSIYAAAALLLVTGVSTLVGCTPDSLTPLPLPTPTWTPAPSPTPPADAPFGWQPDWTEAHTGAAHIVDVHRALTDETSHNPRALPVNQWAAVATEQEYLEVISWHDDAIASGRYATGFVTIDWRTVGAETTADNGHREIIVTQCEDGSTMTVFTADPQVEPPDPVNPMPDRNKIIYTVHFVDGLDDWRVALRRGDGTC
ncbi:MAG: hypothetical protein LBH76_01205 [Propionibacteriaceae bacterium]|jgi:hypothetical protein|nr:hypothetical protein [Propionibacteriaceae bacterium]